MRKTVIVGMALAVAVGFSTIGGVSARAGKIPGVQARNGVYGQQASGQDTQFNSYWFVHGVPPYKDGVEPWKRTQAKDDGDKSFSSYWFVHGVPPYKGGVAPWERM